MDSRFRTAATAAVLALAGPAGAVLILEPPPDAAGPADKAFYERLRPALASLANSADPAIRRLHAAADAASAPILVRPITDDRRTWANDGNRNRGHTEPVDGRPKREGRTRPTGAIVFLPPWGVDRRNKRWDDGLLVHEMMHAVDLSTGRYHPDNRVRERRAVFIQNIWRDRVDRDLRTAYNGEFPTLDYQEAKRLGRIEEYLRHLFSRADLPAMRANAGTSRRKGALESDSGGSVSARPAVQPAGHPADRAGARRTPWRVAQEAPPNLNPSTSPAPSDS